jgi:hypothetical protein
MGMSPRLLRPKVSAPAAPTDPYFSSVALLLHMDGSNGSSVFTDNSSYGHTISTVATAPEISTAESKFGGSSARIFGASGAYSGIESAQDNVFDVGDQDFTLEMWAWPINSSDGDQTLARLGAGGGVDGIYFSHSPDYTFATSGNGWDILSGVTLGALTQAQWQHVALCRNGDTWAGFVDGVARFTQTASGTVFTSYPAVRIGAADANGSASFDGYIDEVRVTIGVCRYPDGTTFTPPDAPFPDQ